MPEPSLPSSFQAVVDEIVALTDADRLTTEQRVWAEALSVGTNVVAAAASFGLTPHVYNTQMGEFYRTTEAFVIETVVESCRIGKRAVMDQVCDRIARKHNEERRPLRVLMLGDGSGGDTLLLSARFHDALEFHYFDVPGSRTYDFAMSRFKLHAVKANLLTEYEKIPVGAFDVILSLEVLEHLPDPVTAIREMADFLVDQGIALVTESFNGVKPNFPTHLHSVVRFAGETRHLFARSGMVLSFEGGKLMEFTRVKQALLRHLWKTSWKLGARNTLPILRRRWLG